MENKKIFKDVSNIIENLDKFQTEILKLKKLFWMQQLKKKNIYYRKWWVRSRWGSFHRIDLYL